MAPAASPQDPVEGSACRAALCSELACRRCSGLTPAGNTSRRAQGAPNYRGRRAGSGRAVLGAAGGSRALRGDAPAGGDGASGAAGAASQGGAEGAGWGFLSKLVTRRPLARGMPARKRARDFGAGTPEAGEAKLGGLPAPIPQQGCPAPRSALFFKRSHLPQVFPDPPPPTEPLQSLERSQRRCCGAGSIPTGKRCWQPSPTTPGDPACPPGAAARHPRMANGTVPCRDLPAPLPAYRAIASQLPEIGFASAWRRSRALPCTSSTGLLN